MQELDKILACKIYGYRTVGELYDDSNGVVWIPRIRTPCILISADDDPFLDPRYKGQLSYPKMTVRPHSHVMHAAVDLPLILFGFACANLYVAPHKGQ